VSYQGEVKLLDFGIARAATSLSNYKEGMLMGKLGYVAPEQASLERAWDHRVDIFAAGIILYELLTKQKPFPRATDVESLVQSRKSRVLPPSAIDERLPRELDPILLRALAYDPDDRYPDARSFADALVDVLFPTPHSAIQDLVGRQMHRVYAERIVRQRAARAHDALVMKVLRHVADQQKAAAYERVAQAMAAPAGGPPVPLADLPSIDVDVDRTDPARDRVLRGPERVRTVRVGASRSVGWGILAGAAVAAGLVAASVWFRPGVLVVTSTPPGAELTVDGRPVPGGTPAAVEGLLFSHDHLVRLSAPGRKPVDVPLPRRIGPLVRKVHVDLASALGTLTVESEPPGATVRLDGQDVGETPLTVLDQRLDERHRLDLSLAGYEIDQFMVLPEKDGTRFHRKLVRRGGGRPSGRE
jgi:hypothetical protein